VLAGIIVVWNLEAVEAPRIRVCAAKESVFHYLRNILIVREKGRKYRNHCIHLSWRNVPTRSRSSKIALKKKRKQGERISTRPVQWNVLFSVLEFRTVFQLLTGDIENNAPVCEPKGLEWNRLKPVFLRSPP